MFPRRPAGWIWIVAFWTVFALLLALQTWIAMIDHGHSVLKIVVYHLGIWWCWAALTPVVFWLARHVPAIPFRLRNILLHLAAMLAMAFVHTALWLGLTMLIRPYIEMETGLVRPSMLQAFQSRLTLEAIVYLAVAAVGYAVDYYLRAARLEQSLSAARLHALELQIQPHFLFNTLNAISALVRSRKNGEAVDMIAGLSDLLRYTLDHGAQRVPLEQEAAMLGRYLEIQRVRFADRLEVKIDVADEARRAAVPTLILQPLAENAVRHGIAQSAAAGRIEVRAFRRDGALRIEMFNTGTLRDTPRGIGLRNTEERLRQLYADGYRFDLRNAHGGVLAEISIPWSEAVA